MEFAQALTLLRSELGDAEEPYLWSDDDLETYLDDAQEMFCRLTDGITDATSAVTRLTVAIGATWLRLNPSILKIERAYLVADGTPIEIINVGDMDRLGLRFTTDYATIRYLIVGMEENKARLHAPALAAGVLQLTLSRRPLVIASDSLFEIGDQHHLHLLKWAKHLAYGKQDSETYDKNKSDQCAAAFVAYCELAKREQGLKRHKIRTVTYGGI